LLKAGWIAFGKLDLLKVLASQRSIQINIISGETAEPFSHLVIVSFDEDHNNVPQYTIGAYFLVTSKSTEVFVEILRFLNRYSGNKFPAEHALGFAALTSVTTVLEKVKTYCF